MSLTLPDGFTDNGVSRVLAFGIDVNRVQFINLGGKRNVERGIVFKINGARFLFVPYSLIAYLIMPRLQLKRVVAFAVCRGAFSRIFNIDTGKWHGVAVLVGNLSFQRDLP